ncbi:MAG: ABC transporter permease [Mycobacteriales bacterium]
MSTTPRVQAPRLQAPRIRALSVRTELLRQLRRRRSQIAAGLAVIVPLLLVLAFEFGSDSGDSSGNDNQSAYDGLVGTATASGLNFALFTLVAASFLLLVLVALLFGDTVASEASWSSLRYLLTAPVPRSKLLASKATVSLISSVAVIVLLVGTALAVGTAMYGWHPLSLPTGPDLPTDTALLRLGAITGYIGSSFLSIAGLAFLLSVSTDSPIGAVGGAVMFYIVTQIFSVISALGVIREVLPGYYGEAWLGLLTTPVQTSEMTKGALVTLMYATVFFAAAWWRFATKDIVS